MRISSVALAFTLALPVVACAVQSNDDASDPASDQGSEQDITAAKKNLLGSWTIGKDSKALTMTLAYEFRPDGTFWRDDTRVLNGFFINGPPPPTRTTGRYTVHAHTLTLHIDSPQPATEELSYEYTAGRILNGVFLPGKEPDTRAHLTLTQQPAPGSHVAYPALTFDRADSYCTANADCDAERADKTWTPDPSATGTPTCDTKQRTCSLASAGVKCGTSTCGADEYCCSPSCGICEKRGAMCPMIACQ